MMTRYKATVAYDGTAYLGYQRQADGIPTVQGVLEQAVTALAPQPVTVWGSGRTDSGVHATGQVIAFDLSWRHGSQALLRALNAHLPEDVVIQELEEAAENFHPRFDARQRAYRYVIEDCSHRQVRRPLTRKRTWQVFQPLDIDLMNRAASLLIGTHDFATFGQPPQGDNTVRSIYTARWERHGERVEFTISANAFLYRMVRSIVGTLKLVGDGSWSLEQFIDAFEARDRRRAGTTAPAHALYLTSVMYESSARS